MFFVGVCELVGVCVLFVFFLDLLSFELVGFFYVL